VKEVVYLKDTNVFEWIALALAGAATAVIGQLITNKQVDRDIQKSQNEKKES
jgi:hypothetical protein